MDAEEQSLRMQERLRAWDMASDKVNTLVEQHSLEQYTSGVIFQHVSTFTKIDQHINHIITVANWLLDRES